MTKIATIIACVAGLSVVARNVAELIKMFRDRNRDEDG